MTENRVSSPVRPSPTQLSAATSHPACPRSYHLSLSLSPQSQSDVIAKVADGCYILEAGVERRPSLAYRGQNCGWQRMPLCHLATQFLPPPAVGSQTSPTQGHPGTELTRASINNPLIVDTQLSSFHVDVEQITYLQAK